MGTNIGGKVVLKSYGHFYKTPPKKKKRKTLPNHAEFEEPNEVFEGWLNIKI